MLRPDRCKTAGGVICARIVYRNCPVHQRVNAARLVCQNNAFPQPLAEDEEAKHLRLMAEGNAHSRNLLIEHNLRLVAHIVKKFDNTGEDLEDLISIGTIGLIKAIESFQQGKGTKLATFAARCIENEILMHLRSLKKTRKDVSLHDPIGTDKEGNEITLIDILGTEADDVVDKVQLKIEKVKFIATSTFSMTGRRKSSLADSAWRLAGKNGPSAKLPRNWAYPVRMSHGSRNGR